MSSSEIDQRIQEALNRFKKAWRANEAITPDQFCEKHPDLAPLLKKRIKDFLYVAEEFVFSKDREDKTTKKESPDAGKVIGDFRIVREIGRGGMGTVYEADQLGLKRKVALKVLSSHLQPSVKAVVKFHREAEAGGRQRHPGIVSVYATGEHQGNHFIAQELVEGGYTLADKLGELSHSEQLPKGYFRKAAKMVRQVAEALDHAHQSGVIHRDIKPSNILLTKEGQPKVTDFGLAKIENAMALSRTGDVAGTPYYMSPEQALGQRIKINKRTDIFSLGVTLYEVLTQKIPFEGETSQEILKKIIISDPVPPDKVNPQVPRDLSSICLKAMEKDQDQRYQSMAEFAEDLDRYLSGDVILAKPSGMGARIIRRMKRNPLVSGALGLAVLTVAAFAVVVPWIIAYKDKNTIKVLEIEQRKAIAAKEHAFKAAKKSAEEAKLSNSVVNFLVNLFESSDPYEAQGKEIKVIEILQRGVEQIKDEFIDQPKIKARLLSTMGVVHINLGNFPDAQELLEKALELCNIHMGAEHEDTLSTLTALATVYRKQGFYKRAESHASKALKGFSGLKGEAHPSTLTSKLCLAAIYRAQNRYKEAEPLFLDALAGYREHSGDDHPDTLASMQSLANLYLDQGRPEEAKPLCVDALMHLRRGLGDANPATLSCMSSLIAAYTDLKDYSAALPLCLEALKNRRKVLPKDHPDTYSSVENLANTYKALGRYNEAEPLYLEALEGRRRRLGDTHSHVTTVMYNLANLYTTLGRFSEAEPLMTKVLEMRSQNSGVLNDKILNAKTGLASIYGQLGRLKEAESLFLEALQGRRKLHGDWDQRTLSAMCNLAMLYAIEKRYAEAEPLLLEALKGFRETLGETHYRTLSAIKILGTLYRELGRYKDAEPLCRESFEYFQRRLGGDHPQTLQAMSSYAALLMELEKYEKAETMIRMVVEGMTKRTGPIHPDTLASTYILALIHKKQGRHKDAEPLLIEIIDGYKKALGKDHSSTLQPINSLVNLYFEGKRYQEAYPLAEDLVKFTPKDDALFDSRKKLLDTIKKKLKH